MFKVLFSPSATMFLLALPFAVFAQDSTRRPPPDSATLDTMFRGPHYRFTGTEDPALLAEIFRQTFKLGKKDAGGLAKPAVICLGVGRDSVVDADRSVLIVMAQHEPPVRGNSACLVTMNEDFAVTEKATGQRAWRLRISALITLKDSIVAYSDFYVGPLFAAGWACTVSRSSAGWAIKHCTMRWIS